MLSDNTGVVVDIGMRSVALTSVLCSDSGWVIGGEVAVTSTGVYFKDLQLRTRL